MFDKKQSSNVARRISLKRYLWVCVSVPVLAIGCSHTIIDETKLIDLNDQHNDSMQMTIFMFRTSDPRGYPTDPAIQKYLRFLQDNGIKIGFYNHEPNRSYAAMIDSTDLASLMRVNELAKEQGIEKPPTVPIELTVPMD